MSTKRRDTNHGLGSAGSKVPVYKETRRGMGAQSIAPSGGSLTPSAPSVTPPLPSVSPAGAKIEDIGPPSSRRPTLRGYPPGQKIAAPRLNPQAPAAAAAAINSKDAFLLSRIDGQLTDEELADVTGMPTADLLASLERLARAGLIFYG